MRRNRLTLLAVFFAAAAMVHAQPERGPRPPGGMHEGRGELMKTLNLTEQQESQIKKLHMELERSQAQIQSKIRMARLDLKEMYLSDKPDRSAIEKSMKEVSDLQHQMKIAFVGFWFSLNGLLNPDQQKLWKHRLGQLGRNFMQQPHPRMHGRGPMMGGRQGLHEPAPDAERN